MDQADRLAISERLRALVGQRAEADISAAARDLSVDEVALGAALDARSPRPTADVLAAIVRTFGVDPTWLLTGEYDGSSHARVLDGDRSAAMSELVQVARRHGIRLDRPGAAPPLGGDLTQNLEATDR